MPEPWVALQVLMLPKDANHVLTAMPGAGAPVLYGTIFGGVILSHIDAAGSIGAKREIARRRGNPAAAFVTVAINRVEFKQPVLVGDVVRFETSVVRIGRTSITMHVNVLAERGAEVIPVTDAEVVYVGIDPTAAERKPVPLLPEAAS